MPKSMSRPRRALAAACLLAAGLASPAAAQPSLSGVAFWHTTDTGSPTGPFWNTLGTNAGDGSYELYLTRSPDPFAGSPSFLNAGVDGDPAFTRQLTTGANTFYFYGTGFPSEFFGLGLFFGSTPAAGDMDPSLAAFVGRGAFNSFGSASDGCARQLGGGCASTNVGLSFVRNGYTVTLTNYQLLRRADDADSPDRVGAYSVGPNGEGDNYGTFTLNVVDANAPPAVVPEPSTWALLGTGLVAVGAVARRRRTPA